MTVLARYKFLCLATGLYYQAQASHPCTTTETTSNLAWFWKLNISTSKFKGPILSFLPSAIPWSISMQAHNPFPIQILFASFIPLSVTFPLIISLLWPSKDWPGHTGETFTYKIPVFSHFATSSPQSRETISKTVIVLSLPKWGGVVFCPSTYTMIKIQEEWSSCITPKDFSWGLDLKNPSWN